MRTGSAMVDSEDMRVTVTVAGRRWCRLNRSEALSRASPDDHVFVLDTGTGTVRFGDGAHGAVPPDGSLVRATYRVGVGASGNVGATWIGTWPPRPFRIAAALEPLGGRRHCS